MCAPIRRRVSWLVLALVPVATACADRRPPEGELTVELAGCAVLRAGPVCARGPDDSLTFWIKGRNEGPARLRSDAGDLPLPSGQAVADGKRYQGIVPPPSASYLEWEELRGGKRARFRLALAQAPSSPVLAEARDLRRKGREAEARALLARRRGELSAELASRADALLGRMALAAGDRTAGLALLERTMTEAVSFGRLSDAVGDGYAMVFALLFGAEPDLPRARALLDRARPWAAFSAERQGDLLYLEGLLRERTADSRGALRLFQEAAARYHRLGLADEGYANQQIALLLTSFGRAEEAFALQRSIVAASAGDSPCNSGAARSNLAWIALSGRMGQSPAAAVPDPGPLLADARRALASCAEAPRRRNALINQALWLAEHDDTAALAAALSDLAAMPDGRTPEYALWETELEARLAEARGQRPQALATWVRHQQLAERLGFGDGQFQSLVAQGQVLRALGQPRVAVQRLLAAQRSLDQLARSVPFGEGRDRFLAFRESGTRQLLQALVDLRQLAQAAGVARAARARLLRSTAQRARLDELHPAERRRWDRLIGEFHRQRAALEVEAERDRGRSAEELGESRLRRMEHERRARAALDEAYRLLEMDRAAAPGMVDETGEAASLAAPGAGELFLVYFQGQAGWLGLAQTTSEIRLARVGVLSPQAAAATLGQRLLGPFARQLASARRVRLFPAGALQEIDWGALPHGRSTLGAFRPLEHGLDLSRRLPPKQRPPSSAAAAAPAPSLLVVADPTSDLPGAAEEGRQVAAAAPGIPTTVLAGKEASRPAVLAALGQARWFHYAGHSSFVGRDGVDSALRLARGTRLLLGDVLSLPTVPQVVVLSGCEAAGELRAGVEGAPGLAQAFLAAGAAAVLAPTGPLPDRAALPVMHLLYEKGSAATALDVAAALSRVRAAMAATGTIPPDFRVYVP